MGAVKPWQMVLVCCPIIVIVIGVLVGVMFARRNK
jgi:hypothetical protein